MSLLSRNEARSSNSELNRLSSMDTGDQTLHIFHSPAAMEVRSWVPYELQTVANFIFIYVRPVGQEAFGIGEWAPT